MSSPSSSNNSLSPYSKAPQRLSRQRDRRSSSKSSQSVASYRSRSRSGSRSRSRLSSGKNSHHRYRKESQGREIDSRKNRSRSKSSDSSSSSSDDSSSSSTSSTTSTSSSRSSSSASRGNDNNSNNSNFRNTVGDKPRQSATSEQHQDLKDSYGKCATNDGDDLRPPPPPPLISKTISTTTTPIQIGKPGTFTKSGIQMKLGTVKTKKEPTKNITVASAFNNDSDEEIEEMPPECKMRMRNIGRDTPTSSGPNSFGKTKQGFIDSKKIFEKSLRQATME